MDGRITVGARLRSWHPAPPSLPVHLQEVVAPDDPEWFARELAIAAAPPWWFWRFMLRTCGWLPSVFGRVQVTGSIPEPWLRGPLLLAVNHIGDFDMFVVAVALRRAGVTPRFLATGSIVAAPVVGALLERAGVIRVVRGTDVAAHALRVTRVALAGGGHVVAYPEGRVGLAPDGWPERGRTGLARLALEADVPVIPVSQWGAHEVLQYANDWGKLRTALAALWRQPALKVHIGPPVYCEDLRPGRVGDANRARARIAAALTRGLVPLRAGEPRDRIAFADPTRPTTAVAAFPGGIVPDDIP
ncbi:1-acyl-sn-glycerol-3-phosphate acyltransferase [Modestobacter sp. DSM 44400]|uniref:lysophospholipid acyltransferase family protein n=1 Tax=Modestobacter sp. DSM 44400 TaxID=1550230 RepID=UPI00089CA44E|nr:lysophospholipid acyltransferase family protein [Modestobacter sp. DSM 44400]SDY20757.1 1-acyl-sn-glycerol-3-phosphate acyltransferase [Modestobacter sp. DSM 44400]